MTLIPAAGSRRAALALLLIAGCATTAPAPLPVAGTIEVVISESGGPRVYEVRDDVLTAVARAPRCPDEAPVRATSPDAQYVAAVTSRERMGISPLALLFTLSGHPVWYQAYRVEISTPDGRLVGTTPYVRGFTGSAARICWR